VPHCLRQQDDQNRAPVATYDELAADLAGRIVDGGWPPGHTLPSVRQLADDHGTSAATAGRALRELAGAGVIDVTPRQRATVATDGAARATRWLHGIPVLRLAGSDDPALARLTGLTDAPIVRHPATGSAAGLHALWANQADVASLHLRTSDGRYNTPFVSRMLAGRRPALVHLWRRDQGIAVPADRVDQARDLADLADLRVALRPTGTGTRTLLDQLARRRDLDPSTFTGPTLTSHLDVALAVATGTADAGLVIRAAARLLDLEFIPLASEPFELALPADHLPQLDTLLDTATSPEFRQLAEPLGYDLTDTGDTQLLAS
jgi:molybdate-binding protein